jgi:hypothetical protein
MSDSSASGARQSAIQKPLPGSISSGIIGLAIGAGAMFMTTYYYYGPEPRPADTGSGAGAQSAGGGAQSGGAPGGGMTGGGGGMGGGGMTGGGGGMGGGGQRGKRNLTSLVGKLDLVSKGISLHLEGDQPAKLAEQLTDLDQPEKKMTEEEAQERVDAIEAILSDQQKETLAQFDLPRGGRRGGAPGGGGPSGPPAGQAPPDDDSNPFQQETNQTRLHSLLGRLKGTSADDASPQKEQPENTSE